MRTTKRNKTTWLAAAALALSLATPGCCSFFLAEGIAHCNRSTPGSGALLLPFMPITLAVDVALLPAELAAVYGLMFAWPA
jgi:hypothetical protein